MTQSVCLVVQEKEPAAPLPLCGPTALAVHRERWDVSLGM